jgi:hypothetical protein
VIKACGSSAWYYALWLWLRILRRQPGVFNIGFDADLVQRVAELATAR